VHSVLRSPTVPPFELLFEPLLEPPLEPPQAKGPRADARSTSAHNGLPWTIAVIEEILALR
jgi:hypothetical protein